MKTLFKLPNLQGSNKRKKILLSSLLLSSVCSFSQETQKDTLKVNQLDEVLISAVRVTTKTPVAFSNISKEELQKRNLGQDIPILLNFLPSVVTTSDAGNGFGYSGIRVRGSDASRVNVTVNGIPYNDAESQGTFWVNMPDFASSVESIQLQRGVGTSTNGAGAFGASLNLLTDATSKESSAEISNSFGSFNSRKHTVKFGTGLMNDHFEVAGRVSNIQSNGYIDRASSDLKSYFLQGTYASENTLIKALVFGGKEKTYQAWNGIDAEMLETDRTYNPSGAYVDDNGVTRFYDNETDNYDQDHYQLHWNQKWNSNWSTNLAFHYTIGKGFYENYKAGEDVSDYALEPQTIDGVLIEETDLIRQKWLDNDFYGTTFSTNYKNEKLDFIVGGGYNKYEGKHFGNVLWTRSIILPEYNFKYYDDFSTKTDFNVFAKANYQITDKFSLFGDLQYRNVNYSANGNDTGLVDDSFDFFNPKAGLTFTVNDKNSLYFSYARANREPNRNDYEGGNPRPEKMNDFELGWRYNTPKTRLNINGYYMQYKDQLVLTGELNDVGAPIRENSGDSYRLGLEIDAVFQLLEKWSLVPNITISTNKNKDFVSDNGTELQELGNTNIAFSPNIVAANSIVFAPSKNFQMSIMTKFVDKQYLSNIDDPASKLDAYTQIDLNLYYQLPMKKVFKYIVFSGTINNIFDEKIVSNAADYGGGYIYYFPQAGINFLAGLTLKF